MALDKLTSLNLFLTCKMGVLMILVQKVVRIKLANICRPLSTVPGTWLVLSNYELLLLLVVQILALLL